MNQQKAEQQARAICHKEGSYWYQVETEITTALLAAYEAGKKEGERSVAERVSMALQPTTTEDQGVRLPDAREHELLHIIERCHYHQCPTNQCKCSYCTDYRAARAVLEAKSEGTTTESQNHTNNMITILNEPKLQIQASDDGVWLHFTPTECRKQASINLSNYAKEGNGIAGEAILAWCKEFAVRHSNGCAAGMKGGE